MKSEYSDEEILCELREVNEQIDSTLTRSDVEERCSFSSTTCYNHFENFSEAKRQAGIEVVNPKDITDEEYLEELHRLKEDLGRRPRSIDMAEHSKYSVQPYQDRWGSWADALRAAGMELDQQSSVSEEELLAELARLAKELDRAPTSTDVDEKAEFSYSTYRKRFGGICSARKKAGLTEEIDRTERVTFTCDWCGGVEEKKPSEAKNRDYCSSTCANRARSGITNEELIDSLKNLAEELGRAPSAKEFNEQTEYWHSTLATRFGSWSETLRKIGYEPLCPKDISDAELLDELRDIQDRAGRSPRTNDLKEYGSVSTSWPYVSRFGSWADALEEAGIEPDNTQRKGISKQELIKEFQRVAEDLGRAPSYNEIAKHADFSAGIYERVFGSFLQAKEACGFDPVPTDNLPRGEDHYAWKGGTKPRYGKSWRDQREKAIERDDHTCQSCGIAAEEHLEQFGTDLHVHHITPWDEFDNHEERNKLSNLITLCARCHRTWEDLPVKPQVMQR